MIVFVYEIHVYMSPSVFRKERLNVDNLVLTNNLSCMPCVFAYPMSYWKPLQLQSTTCRHTSRLTTHLQRRGELPLNLTTGMIIAFKSSRFGLKKGSLDERIPYNSRYIQQKKRYNPAYKVFSEDKSWFFFLVPNHLQGSFVHNPRFEPHRN
jgi:hypothetical protein